MVSLWSGLRFLSSLAQLSCSGDWLSTFESLMPLKMRGLAGLWDGGRRAGRWLDTRNTLHPLWARSCCSLDPESGLPPGSLLTPKGIFIKGLWSVKIKGKTAAPGQVFLRFPCQAGSCQNGLPALATCAGADGWALRATGGLGVRSHPWLSHRFS